MDSDLGLNLATELSKKPDLELLDGTALTEAQRKELNLHKVKKRLENEFFLREHPEIGVLLSSFMNEVLLKRPENIRSFASAYFTDPSLPDRVRALVDQDKRSH